MRKNINVFTSSFALNSGCAPRTDCQAVSRGPVLNFFRVSYEFSKKKNFKGQPGVADSPSWH